MGLFGVAGAAGAHSQLTGSSPSQGARLDQSPSEIRLTYSEAVTIDDRSVRVLDADGNAVDVSASAHPDGAADVVVTSLPPLRDGQYVVGWKAISADSHPINGAFVFTVGEAPTSGSVKGLIESVLDEETGSAAVGWLFTVVRLMAFAATGLVIGAVALWNFTGASGDDVDGGLALRSRRFAATAGVGVVSALAGFLLQGPYSTGRSLSAVVSPSAWSSTFGITSGRLWLVRAALFGVAALIARGALAQRTVARRVTTVVVAVALAVCIAASGHAVSGPWPAGAFALDVAHLLAMGTWFGGLVIVVSLLWRRERADGDHLRTVVDRFSTMAFVSIAVLTATGVAQSYRQLGELSQVTSTGYGKLLIAKVVVVGFVVSLGWYGRIVLRGVAGAAALPHLRRSVMAEVVLGVAVLAVTAVLTNTVPAREQIAQPFDRTIVDDDQFVNVSVSPARVGANEMHVTVSPTGALAAQPVDELTVELVLPERDLGPIEVPMEVITSDHVTTEDAAIPVAGKWDVRVTVRYGEFTSRTTVASVDIR